MQPHCACYSDRPHLQQKGISNEIITEALQFLQPFQLCLVSPIGMSTTNHDIGIGEVVHHCLGRGGVCILPLNGYVLESLGCGVSLRTLRGPLVELSFNYIISASLTDACGREELPTEVITNAGSSIVQSSTCHRRT